MRPSAWRRTRNPERFTALDQPLVCDRLGSLHENWCFTADLRANFPLLHAVGMAILRSTVKAQILINKCTKCEYEVRQHSRSPVERTAHRPVSCI